MFSLAPTQGGRDKAPSQEVQCEGVERARTGAPGGGDQTGVCATGTPARGSPSAPHSRLWPQESLGLSSNKLPSARPGPGTLSGVGGRPARKPDLPSSCFQSIRKELLRPRCWLVPLSGMFFPGYLDHPPPSSCVQMTPSAQGLPYSLWQCYTRPSFITLSPSQRPPDPPNPGPPSCLSILGSRALSTL